MSFYYYYFFLYKFCAVLSSNVSLSAFCREKEVLLRVRKRMLRILEKDKPYLPEYFAYLDKASRDFHSFCQLLTHTIWREAFQK